MSRNILDFYKAESVGSVLDQNQQNTEERRADDKVVFKNLFHKLISLNEMTQVYGITLTFRSTYHKDDPESLHRAIYKDLMSQAKWKKNNFFLFPEFTEKGILHYHGVVWDCYELPFIQMSKYWHRKFGFAKVELKIKYYYCGNGKECMYNEKTVPKSCWCHYCIKDYDSVGLNTLYNLKSKKGLLTLGEGGSLAEQRAPLI